MEVFSLTPAALLYWNIFTQCTGGDFYYKNGDESMDGMDGVDLP